MEEKGIVPANFSVDEVMRDIVKDTDFATIHGNIEITRDLALKLFSRAQLDYDADPQVVEVGGDVVAMVKAKVWKGDRHGLGLGACSLKEIAAKNDDNTRGIHDALAIAETRAYKRALEMAIGLPFINDIIQRLFGGYHTNAPKHNGYNKPKQDSDEMYKMKQVWLDKIRDVMMHEDFPDHVREEATEKMKGAVYTVPQLKTYYDNALKVLDKYQRAKKKDDAPKEEVDALGDEEMFNQPLEGEHGTEKP